MESWRVAGPANLPKAWDWAAGFGVTVAVLDTELRPHLDLGANVIGGFEFIADPAIAWDGDRHDADASDPGDGTRNARLCVGQWPVRRLQLASVTAALTHNAEPGQHRAVCAPAQRAHAGRQRRLLVRRSRQRPLRHRGHRGRI